MFFPRSFHFSHLLLIRQRYASCSGQSAHLLSRKRTYSPSFWLPGSAVSTCLHGSLEMAGAVNAQPNETRASPTLSAPFLPLVARAAHRGSEISRRMSICRRCQLQKIEVLRLCTDWYVTVPLCTRPPFRSCISSGHMATCSTLCSHKGGSRFPPSSNMEHDGTQGHLSGDERRTCQSICSTKNMSNVSPQL